MGLVNVKLSGLNKNLPGKVISKAIKSIPGVGTVTNIGGAINDIASGVGKALGLGKTEADKRKDRTRKFHDALRAGNWSHIEKTASDREAGGTRFKGLAKEALWVLQQRALGYGLEEIRAAIAGNGGAEARGGRLPNLDGSPNNTETLWRNTHGSAGAAASSAAATSTPELTWDDSAPAVSRAPRRATPRSGSTSSRPASAPAAPRPKPPCKYGPRDADGYCPKKPPSVRQSSGISSSARPCKYGPRGPDGLCPKKPSAYATGGRTTLTAAEKRANKAAAAAQRKLETAVTKTVTNTASTIYKNLGPLGTVKLLAKASLVGAAGVAAYALTKKLMTLRPKTWQDAKNELAQATIQARAAARAQNPEYDWNDPAVNAKVMGPFNQYFKERKAIMDQSEAMGVPPHLEFIFDDENPTYGNPYTN